MLLLHPVLSDMCFGGLAKATCYVLYDKSCSTMSKGGNRTM